MDLTGRDEPTTAKRQQVQAAVLRATEDLLSGGASFADLKIERIATGAGLSRTAFYFYFRDKRELLVQLAQEITDALYSQADRWFSGAHAPERDMREALGSIAALYDEHGPLMRAIVEVSTYDEEFAVFWRGLLGRFVMATRRRIEAAQQAGEAGPMEAETTAFALVWMTERTFYQQLMQQPTSWEELIEAVLGIWMRSIYGRLGPG